MQYIEFAQNRDHVFEIDRDGLTQVELIEAAVANLGHLRNADLTEMDLSGLNLYEIDLSGTNFSNTKMVNASLVGCNLTNAQFYRAIIVNTNFHRTNLTEAGFNRSTLINVCFDSVTTDVNTSMEEVRALNSLIDTKLPNDEIKAVNAKQAFIPSEGSFVAWKAAQTRFEYGRNRKILVKLLIPEDAERVSARGTTVRKCRVSKALVLGFYELDGTGSIITEATPMTHNYGHIVKPDGEYFNWYTDPFYVLNQVSVPDEFDPNPNAECSNGINFFLTQDEAREYAINN
jgi:hypothetical protein